MYLGRKMDNAMLFTGCPYRPYFCSKARPAQLSLKKAEKGGAIVKMKFLVALFIAPVLNGRRQSHTNEPNHNQVWTILLT